MKKSKKRPNYFRKNLNVTEKNSEKFTSSRVDIHKIRQIFKNTSFDDGPLSFLQIRSLDGSHDVKDVLSEFRSFQVARDLHVVFSEMSVKVLTDFPKLGLMKYENLVL
jgi:hypothetical protein